MAEQESERISVNMVCCEVEIQVISTLILFTKRGLCDKLNLINLGYSVER